MTTLTEADLQTAPPRNDASVLDELRRRELSRLDAQVHVYLDYTGGGLYADRQIRRHAELLRSGVFGNPHSINPTSTRSTELVEESRRRVLRYFRADPEEYVGIFTANASHALKLVGESYPFEAGDRFLLTFDNHNSVNGIREYDRTHGAETTYVPLDAELRIDADALMRELERDASGRHRLFAYPAQSNFSGVQHSPEWIGRAQEAGWDVLVDAAAFVPTNRLDLSRWRPDFVALSFYKMFGYPTGVGMLLARRPALAQLHRPWFAGGTIAVASVQADRHVLAPGAAAFEDGTLDYLAIPAVSFGLDLLEEVGVETIHDRVMELTGRLIRRLGGLRHGNGRPLVRIYGPRSTTMRGGTLALNLFDSEGTRIDHQAVERRAAERNISIRTGCFCNPGAGEAALELSRAELERCFAASGGDMTYEDLRSCVDPVHGSGAVRVSLGWVSNSSDVERFVELVGSFAEPADQAGLASPCGP